MDIKKEPEDVETDSSEQNEDIVFNNNTTEQSDTEYNPPYDVFIKQEVDDSQTEAVNFKEETVYIKSEFNTHSEVDGIDNTSRQGDRRSRLSMMASLCKNSPEDVNLSKIKCEQEDKGVENSLLVSKQEKIDDSGECSYTKRKLTKKASSVLPTKTIPIEVPLTGQVDEKPFRCEKCIYKSSRLGDLKRHRLIHSESYIDCADCAYKTKNSRDLKTHRLIHSNIEPLKCELCEFKSFVACRMKAHKTIHTSEKPYKCDLCEYKCTQSGSLKTHKRLHSGEKPFQCNQCNYKCRKSSHLKVHQTVHAVEKPFRCDVCDYKCKHSGSLKTHRMIHTGEKPYNCDECDYKCKLIAHLKVHKLTHTNRKPFQCGLCDYACNQAGSLKNHMKVHANEININQ